MGNMKRAAWLMALMGAAAIDARAGEPRPRGPAAEEREFTLGLVQREVRVGMSAADVVAALGSPNILTRDAEGRESWVYDKIATEASFSTSSTGIGGGALGSTSSAASALLGLVGAHHSKEKGASRTSQRTLTVIVKFARDGGVESFTFHASRF